MNATPARQAALRVLDALRTGELADAALRREIERLPQRDRAWTQELVQGTLRLRGRLDHILEPFASRPLERLDAVVLDALRLGTYQLLEMDSVPAYAAVSESVSLVRPHSPGGARLVNAVLQSVKRAEGVFAFPDFAADPVAYLSTWGSHPRWLVERWVARFGAESARQLVEANNQRPALYLRPVGIAIPDALATLTAHDVAAASVAGAPNAIRLGGGAALTDALAAIPAIVQDPAAGVVARYAAPPADALVLDLCAAPGGKSIALAVGTGSASVRRVVAADASKARIGRVRENLARLPALPVRMVVMDGRRPAVRAADVVLVDAPCTGTGTLRRHADGRWRLGADDVASLARLQAELLDAAAAVVRPGGLLVYATCSLEAEENDMQVDAFLERNRAFAVEAPAAPALTGLAGDGRLRLLPQEQGFDGAFAARLRRKP